jgi:hypothetical protein
LARVPVPLGPPVTRCRSLFIISAVSGLSTRRGVVVGLQHDAAVGIRHLGVAVGLCEKAALANI